MRSNKPIIFALVLLGFVGAYFAFTKTRTADIADNKERVAIIQKVKEEARAIDVIEKEETIAAVTPSKVIAPEVVTVNIDLKVPFSSQAPLGGWKDERQQDGCEEASALMAMLWVTNTTISKEDALKRILAISDFEQKKYGEYRDISVYDVVARIFKDYFKYDKVAVKEDATIADIISALRKGSIVLAPANGQLLHNPYFTAPGPERHMLVIRGYDSKTKEFITNDPGTKRGEAYRYKENTLFDAVLAYPTGYHEAIEGMPKNVVVVSK